MKARTYDKLMFRHWNHYYDGKISHLFIVPIEGGVARDLTPGEHEVPPFSLGGQDQYAFSPDGKEVAYTCNTDENEATSTNSDLFVVPVSGGTAKRLPAAPGADSTPIYSPDGKYIAYRSQLRGRLRERPLPPDALRSRAAARSTDVSPNFDRWVDSIAWSPDSKTIYLTAGNEGENPIYALHVGQANPWPEELVDGYNDSPTPTPDGKMLVFNTQSICRAQRDLHRAADVRAVPHGLPAEFLQGSRLPPVQGEAADSHERRCTLQGRDGADGDILVHRRGERESPGLHRPAAELRRRARSIP